MQALQDEFERVQALTMQYIRPRDEKLLKFAEIARQHEPLGDIELPISLSQLDRDSFVAHTPQLDTASEHSHCESSVVSLSPSPAVPKLELVEACLSPIPHAVIAETSFRNACVGTQPADKLDVAINTSVVEETAPILTDVGTGTSIVQTRSAAVSPVAGPELADIALSPIPVAKPSPVRLGSGKQRKHHLGALNIFKSKHASPAAAERTQPNPTPETATATKPQKMTPAESTPQPPKTRTPVILSVKTPEQTSPGLLDEMDGAWDATPNLLRQLKTQQTLDTERIFPSRYGIPKKVSDLFGRPESHTLDGRRRTPRPGLKR
ncbi:Incenp [Carpediemonas membranifera]|uniref:Incenp n=1 Tax=Carpediemonas membranifera TaxID=201153 RepID=A0A8J6AZR0_9EUKA|nr:Incenp [Carpediemonas membranifera]|eukprot:KAG9396230.1 Incenp [Carpediemonas membranifera]